MISLGKQPKKMVLNMISDFCSVFCVSIKKGNVLSHLREYESFKILWINLQQASLLSTGKVKKYRKI